MSTGIGAGTTTSPNVSGLSETSGKIEIKAGILTKGSHTITVKATGYTDATVTQTITAPPSSAPPAPFINTIVFTEDAQVGDIYSDQLIVTGGTMPFTWSITNGSLPTGLSLNDRGEIVGTPTGQAGQYTFTVKVTDANNLSATRQLTLTVDGPTSVPAVSTASIAPNTIGQAYDQSLDATGGSAPYTWSITNGALPPGLSLNDQTGEITGTSSKSGVYNITVQVKDANGVTATQTIPIDILQSYDREVIWNGQVKNIPAIVGNDGGTQTTYMPIWYVMQLLKSMGIQSTWNGHDWDMNTSSTADLSGIQAGTGSASIYLNRTLVQRVNSQAKVDPSTNKLTTYMPIWYVEQVLNRVGLQSNWNGTTWSVTEQNS
ncbi:putative Ig domain-containing protein [Alicyclobacillus fodiniaquatilis]|uniref:Ig domain-containing protein n=1 Tax=Alicyclobacillus fodiniaquatilis TaxID=1661150 RepID=A0ABW4JHH1_9BACL